MRGVRVLLLLPALLLLVGGLGLPPAAAQGADAQGWWSALHHESDPVAPPTPPDVGEKDLLLQGGDPGRLVPPGVLDPTPAPSALGALRFQVDPAAQVGGLVLQVGAGAQAADVRAYPTSTAWAPAQNGPVEKAPEPDLTRFSTGRLSEDGATLTFPDIGRLVTEDGLLSVVLVPGAADRVVVHPPTAAALTVFAPAPQASPGPTAFPSAPVYEAPPLPPAVALPPLQPLAPAPVVPSVAPTTAPQPVTAAPPVTPAAGTVLVADDDRTRLLVLAEALLVAVFFGLLGQGPLAVLARWTGAAEPDAGAERGLGRFRSARVGTAPRL